MNHIENQQTNLPENMVRRKIITVREETETRPAVQIIIEQKVNKKLVRVLPTMRIVGRFPRAIESPRFAREFGESLLYGAAVMIEWSKA